MAIFGGSGFIRTYGDNRPDLTFIYRHGGIAITVYVFFYFAIFGRDEVKRMFLKALFGLLRIGVQVGWLAVESFRPRQQHLPTKCVCHPFLFFVLYTFLMRRAVLDLINSLDDPARRKTMKKRYNSVTLAVNAVCIAVQWLA